MASETGNQKWRGDWTLCTAEAFQVYGRNRQPLPAAEAAARVDAWASDPGSWLELLSLYRELSGDWLDRPSEWEIQDLILPFLREAFEWQRALAVPRLMSPASPPRAAGGSVLQKLADAVPAALRSVVKGLSFVEIVLQDENGKPVAGEAYELKLPDGSVRTGNLDGKGTVRVEGIPSGDCTVKFPERDRRDFL